MAFMTPAPKAAATRRRPWRSVTEGEDISGSSHGILLLRSHGRSPRENLCRTIGEMMGGAASRASTVAFLHTHGIEVMPEDLDPLVKEAVARLQRTLYRRSSRADLTESEAKALEGGGFVLDPGNGHERDPLAETVAEYAALLKSSLSTSDVAKRLGVDSSRIRQRLTSQPPTLYGIRIGTSWYIPEFQLEGDALVRGLGEVVAHLDPELHPVAVFRWFTSASPDLSTGDAEGRNLSPRDWLRLGFPVQTVVELASNL
jgi:hypothetical protein